MALEKPQQLSEICKLLARAVEELRKDILEDGRKIAAQEAFIRELIEIHAKPALVQQAQDRLAQLKDTLERDTAQLKGFEDEFNAHCA